MPKRPSKKICPRCGMTVNGECKRPKCVEYFEKKRSERAEREKEYDKKRGSIRKRGYPKNWAKITARKLKKDPLCECDDCRGHYVVAEMVHHKDGNPRNNAPENLMSMTNSCHAKIDHYALKGLKKDGSWVCI